MGHNDLRQSKKYTPRANIKCHLFFILFYIITVSYFKVAKFAIETQKYEIYVIEQIMFLICFLILEIFFVYHTCIDNLNIVHTEFYKGKISCILYIYGCCVTYGISVYLLFFNINIVREIKLDAYLYIIIFILFFFLELIYMMIILKRRNSLRCRIYCFFRHMICNLLINTGIVLNLILFVIFMRQV